METQNVSEFTLNLIKCEDNVKDWTKHGRPKQASPWKIEKRVKIQSQNSVNDYYSIQDGYEKS